MNGIDLEMITVSVDYNLAYYNDFSDVFMEYLNEKNTLKYFCENNLDRFDSEEEVIMAYAQLMSSMSDCSDLISRMSQIVIESNNIVPDNNVLGAVIERLNEPIRSWLDEVSFMDLADDCLSNYDLRPLLKGRVKKGFFK